MTRKLWFGFDLLACLAVAFAALYVAYLFAGREYAFTGQLLFFLAIVSLACVAMFATRYHVLCGLILVALFVTIDQIDQVKFAATNTRLLASDWFVATNFARDFDYSIVVQYRKQMRALYSALAILAIAAPVIWFCERAAIRNVRGWRPPTGSAIVGLVAACLCVAALLHSQYSRSLAIFPAVDLHWAKGGLRLSSLMLQLRQLGRMDSDFKSLQAEAKTAGLLPPPSSSTPASCGASRCPDIVFVHLESVFDPVLLADFRATGGYIGQMEKRSGAASKSGLLRVHTWGGASWVSEFAVLCGANPDIYGPAGGLPHLNVSPYVRNCLPNHLKRLGYATHAIYTSYWNFVGVGAGFKRYGVDDFIDIRRIKDAPSDWRLQRDKYFIGEARRILAEPSDRPRFIFVSTNWNHGPHGSGTHTATYKGPFDASQARDAPTRDYVNRLNDTYTEMAALERDLTSRPTPTLLIFYGDHHPGFAKTYAPNLPADPYVGPDFLTFYRLARNYGPGGTQARETLWIEELPTRILEFAGIPLPPAMAAIRGLREKCKNTDVKCPSSIKSGIAAAVLAD